MSRRVWPLVFLVWSACGPTPLPPIEDKLVLVDITPTEILPGTTLHLEGCCFSSTDNGLFILRDTVGANGKPIRAETRFVSEGLLEVDVGAAFDPLFDSEFDGMARLEVSRETGVVIAELRTRLTFVSNLEPRLDASGPLAVAFGESLTFAGGNFVLPTEGTLELVFAGTITPEGGTAESVSGLVLHPEVVNRRLSMLTWTPVPFGLTPSRLEGTLTPRQSTTTTLEGAPTPLDLTVIAPTVVMSRVATSRGQKIIASARGLLPDDPLLQQSTSLVMEGEFTNRAGTVTPIGPTDVSPTTLSAEEVTLVLRPEVVNGTLVGLGAEPGQFVGDYQLRLRHGGEEWLGPKHALNLTVNPTQQAVYLKFLPSYRDALVEFGLLNAEELVRARVLSRCRDAYSAFNVTFDDERPVYFADYTVIEIGGPDPNGAGLLGLDNTTGLDVGNLRLDDVIGGANAELDELGTYAFGGVFVESFFAFSPSLPEASSLAHSDFDLLFGPFSPRLGGVEVSTFELDNRQGRFPQLRDASTALGNLIGETVVHEIGHALGLASTGTLHHDGSTPGLIMNPGSARPFTERAEVDGAAPATWGPDDSAYLAEILPKP